MTDDFMRIQHALWKIDRGTSLETWFESFRQVLTQLNIHPRNDQEWRDYIDQHLPNGVVPSATDLQRQWVKDKIDMLVPR